MRALMLFLDGVGIGVRDPEVNPLFAARMSALRSILGGDLPSLHHRRLSSVQGSHIPLDATLGVPGLPQSGTGQTALFTGFNGARIVGRHFGPYPYSTLRPIIQQHNIFRQLLDAGKSVLFANAFPQRFFDYLSEKRPRLTVTTFSCLNSGVPLLREHDLRAGEAISADITNAGWHALGYPSLPVVTALEAGKRLARLSGSHDFVLFEYWKTDHAGHSMSRQEALQCLDALDGLLGGLLSELDSTESLLLITSDHGNIEDLSIKTHTRHPVPLVLYGAGHQTFAREIEQDGKSDLTSITPALVRYILNQS